MSLFGKYRYMNPYDLHKALINEYYLTKAGDTKRLRRDASKDRTDSDVLRDNHRFLWEEGETANTWEERFARRYYDKLFKEYCIADLTFYRENKIALRWRVEKEVVSGKGQFSCGSKTCETEADLRSWEVNFGYVERGEKKNALVKIRLCENCSKKLNYRTKRKEVKRLKSKKKRFEKPQEVEENSNVPSTSSETAEVGKNEASLWASLKPVEVKTREEEIDEYLDDLLL